jgi:hypothetical protein
VRRLRSARVPAAKPYAALAQAYDLAPITLTPKTSGEALLTLIGLRTAELCSLFERS